MEKTFSLGILLPDLHSLVKNRELIMRKTRARKGNLTDSQVDLLNLIQNNIEFFDDLARHQDADMAVIEDDQDRGPFIEVEGAGG